MKTQPKSSTPAYRKDKQKMKLTTSNKSGNAIKFDADARKEYILGMGKRKVERKVVARELQKMKEDLALKEKRRLNREQDKKLWENFEAKMKENGDAEDDEVGMITSKTKKNTTTVIDYERNESSSDEEDVEQQDSENESGDEDLEESDDEGVTSVRVTVQPMTFGKDNLLQMIHDKEEIAQEVYERKQQIKEQQREQLEKEEEDRKSKHFMNSKSHLRSIPGISQLQFTADELDKKVLEFQKEQKLKKHTVQAKSKINKSGKKRSKMLSKLKNKRKSKE